MKMQNEVQAPITGTVVSVNISEGDAIEANIPLLVIEPVATDEDSE
jgi:biotin carboxyl carrier protein